MKQRTLLSLLIILFVVLADQCIKHAVMDNMMLYERVVVTPWFHLLYTQNQGMAFGMSFFGTWLLALLRICAIAGFGWYLVRCIRRHYPMGFIVCIAMVIAGALGNIIDNVLGYGTGQWLNGHVTDMFYFPLFQWPDWVPLLGGNTFFGAVFNFADASISCGAIALIIFYHKFMTRNDA
ncbi:MAG: signal peptidase II [Bacteroidaceae bacterium]|nr:signal peptidase II [Candidatus Equimonas faecalis]MCQ2206356.1 signal peptidase II [Bacteroidaceae bacterium]